MNLLSLKVEQGEASGRPGQVSCTVKRGGNLQVVSGGSSARFVELEYSGKD